MTLEDLRSWFRSAQDSFAFKAAIEARHALTGEELASFRRRWEAREDRAALTKNELEELLEIELAKELTEAIERGLPSALRTAVASVTMAGAAP